MHMTKDEKSGRRLSSWKDIADYLGWDERTCLRWEKKLGLPIHRIDPASKRSRVFAYVEDLDRWLAGRGDGLPTDLPAPEPQAEAGRYGRRPSGGILRRARPFLIVAPAAVLLGLVFVIFLKPPGDPADFTIRGSVLVIRDEAGRDLWSYETGLARLQDEEYYRRHFQNAAFDPYNFRQSFPFLIIQDIDGDGRVEVIFTAQSEDPVDMGPVVCFDRRGRELWRFEPGREMTYGSKVYSNDYWVEILDLVDLDGDGRLETVVVADQIPFFPTQLAILDSRGKRLGEYWNSGRLSSFVALDLDGDSRKELVLGGKNNEYKKPCLVVLDSGDVRGGSPQSEAHYSCADLEPGTERHYLLFPKTEVDMIEDMGGDSLSSIQVLQNKRLALWMAHALICYEIDSETAMMDVRLSDTFRNKYTRYQAEGRIAAGELDEASFTRDLAGKVLYRDGLGWTMEPIMKSARLNKKPENTLIPR